MFVAFFEMLISVIKPKIFKDKFKKQFFRYARGEYLRDFRFSSFPKMFHFLNAKFSKQCLHLGVLACDS